MSTQGTETWCTWMSRSSDASPTAVDTGSTDASRARRTPVPPAPGTATSTTGVDDHSRLARGELLTDEREETAAGFWKRANAFFAAAGITVKRGTDRQRLLLPRTRLRNSPRRGHHAQAPPPPRPTARSSGSSAPRGAWSYPWIIQEELEGRFLGLMAYPASKGLWGQEHARKPEIGPSVRDGALGDPCDMAKAGLPESQSPEDGSSHPPERRLKPVPALRRGLESEFVTFGARSDAQ